MTKIINISKVVPSSEGVIHNSIGDMIKTELMKILKGNSTIPCSYKLDDMSEMSDPHIWLKTNPICRRWVDK